MNISTKYNPKLVEDKWYKYWIDNGYFSSVPDHREPYTIVIPPPNVTGVLHMGHMLNNTIQDVLIRRARLRGFNACWVPGTDHASIATEAKVVAKLKSEGIEKSSLSREDFLTHAWEWTNKHGGIILEQLKKIGCSCDWDRTKFTMEDNLSSAVTKTFVDLYQKKLIYRDYRMVNWDSEAKTTLSDEEVIHTEKQGQLYHIAYRIEDTSDSLIVATTRPETIFGDTAVCVNPKDKRYTHLIGKKAIVPVLNKSIPIISDEYVDMAFGTGCLKITPSHDANDKLIGERHGLEFVNIFNEDASLNDCGLHYCGKDRFEVRKSIVKELESLGHLLKVENYTHKVGISERTGTVVEPRMSVQWFLKMKDLSTPALRAIMEKEINLFPNKFKNTYRHWMENIRDWNISRQLWWGHQIPAYFYNKSEFVVAETPQEALRLAQSQSQNPKLTLEDLTQETDVLDTWFSSWLWPISVFDGIMNPQNEEISYYYPSTDLVTAPEILFFWVARMIIAGYEYQGEKPFKNVYLTGIVRDKKGRKMSKSLGNSPDPLDLIDKYGADGVRVGMLLCSPAGNDLMFDEELCKQGSAFSNKIWNAFRLVKSWDVDQQLDTPEESLQGVQWFNNRFYQVLEDIEDSYGRYKISEALMLTYKLFWDDFCSWLLEIVKPSYGKAIDKKTYQSIIEILENLLKLLHPFMPFISEEIWQQIKKRSSSEALLISSWPKGEKFNQNTLTEFEYLKNMVVNLRSLRKKQQLAFKQSVNLICVEKESTDSKYDGVIKKLCNVANISRQVDYKDEKSVSFRVKSNEYFMPVEEQINLEEEIQKLEQDLVYTKGFLKSVESKLSNENFLNNAPKKVVETEKKKQADAFAKIDTIKGALETLRNNK